MMARFFLIAHLPFQLSTGVLFMMVLSGYVLPAEAGDEQRGHDRPPERSHDVHSPLAMLHAAHRAVKTL